MKGMNDMKTNLASLMSIVSEEEKQFSSYGWSLRTFAYNTSIQELHRGAAAAGLG